MTRRRPGDLRVHLGPAISREAVEVHDAAPVVDLHCDAALQWRYARIDLARRHAPNPVPSRPLVLHTDLPRLREGGVALVVLGVPAPLTGPASGPDVAEQLMLACHAAMARDGRTRVMTGAGASEIVRAKRDGELRVAFGIEGAHLVGRDLAVLPTWKRLGLRLVGPAHLLPNLACWPSSIRSEAGRGLSAHGRRLVEAVDAAGLVLDLAHVNARGFEECLEIHRGPVVVSHTALASQTPLWRNVSDDQAKRVAERGGVVGVIFYPAFLRRSFVRAFVSDVVDHIDAARKVVGVEHIALGSDFDGGITLPRDMRDATDLVLVTDTMLRRGYTPEDCTAILGGNALRVLEAAA